MKTMKTKALRKLRKQKGITAAHVARYLGISRSHLCDLENERRNMSEAQRALYLEAIGAQ